MPQISACPACQSSHPLQKQNPGPLYTSAPASPPPSVPPPCWCRCLHRPPSSDQILRRSFPLEQNTDVCPATHLHFPHQLGIWSRLCRTCAMKKSPSANGFLEY